MNSNIVLSKIVSLLNLEKEEVKLATARLEDGTVVESETFDVGQEVFVVGEDGEKSPAPNGEHELFLRDEEGNEVRIRIITEDGVITERENVEELPADEAESLEEEENKEEMTSEATELEEEVVEGEEEEVKEEEISLEDIKKGYEEMAYRIEELEKKIAEMQVEEEVEEEVEAEEEEELPKLDGAPTELSRVTNTNAAKKIKNRQSAFLSKLYK